MSHVVRMHQPVPQPVPQPRFLASALGPCKRETGKLSTGQDVFLGQRRKSQAPEFRHKSHTYIAEDQY